MSIKIEDHPLVIFLSLTFVSASLVVSVIAISELFSLVGFSYNNRSQSQSLQLAVVSPVSLMVIFRAKGVNEKSPDHG